MYSANFHVSTERCAPTRYCIDTTSVTADDTDNVMMLYNRAESNRIVCAVLIGFILGAVTSCVLTLQIVVYSFYSKSKKE